MKKHTVPTENAFLTLMRPNSPWKKSPQQRAEMTIACHDADYLPRVKNAGDTQVVNGVDAQIMHNGLLVKRSGYQGEWQEKVIRALRGVHEPQEEKVFYEVSKRIKNANAMIELGSWWSYYSMWYLRDHPKAKAICCEPDPENIELGKMNMQLNGFEIDKQAIFYPVASGSEEGKKLIFKTEAGNDIRTVIKTVDNIIKDASLNKVDILHFDIQGAELETLRGAEKSIRAKKIRFVFISTHHYAISENPSIHEECLDFIETLGGTIVASHSVLESCSGDGLIVASFDPVDKDFKVDVSHQPSHDSLFRPYEEDVRILWDSHNALLAQSEKQEKLLNENQLKLQEKDRQLAVLRQELEEIGHLKDHVKRQVKIRINKIKGAK